MLDLEAAEENTGGQETILQESIGEESSEVISEVIAEDDIDS
jgi:hypothetical protein